MFENIQTFFENHQMAAGIIIGIVAGFIPSVWAGHLGNKWTENRNKKSLEAKQKKFIDELSSATKELVYSEPKDETEVGERRNLIKSKVNELSNKIFNQDYPEIQSFRPESTEYPEIDCKWCHRSHKACNGTKGECKNCTLPLDLWIGSQR